MGMQMFIEAVGRNCKIVNLDFANDNLPYTPAIDVRELVSLEVLRLFLYTWSQLSELGLIIFYTIEIRESWRNLSSAQMVA